MLNTEAVIFLVDYSNQMGLERVRRCLRMALLMDKSRKIFFAMVGIPEPIVQFFEKQGVDFISLETKDPVDLLLFIYYSDSCKEFDVHNIILDGELFDGKFQTDLKNWGFNLTCIADHDGEFLADIVINPIGNIPPDNDKKNPFTNLMLGSKFALILNDSRYIWPYHRDNTGPNGELSFWEEDNYLPRPIIIYLEGFRLFEAFLLPIIREVENSIERHFFSKDKLIHILADSLDPDYDLIVSFTSMSPRYRLFTNLTNIEIAWQMSICETAIVSCSSVIYEVGRIGIPCIPIQINDSQKDIKNLCKKTSFFQATFDKFSINNLSKELLKCSDMVSDIMCVYNARGIGDYGSADWDTYKRFSDSVDKLNFGIELDKFVKANY